MKNEVLEEGPMATRPSYQSPGATAMLVELSTQCGMRASGPFNAQKRGNNP